MPIGWNGETSTEINPGFPLVLPRAHATKQLTPHLLLFANTYFRIVPIYLPRKAQGQAGGQCFLHKYSWKS